MSEFKIDKGVPIPDRGAHRPGSFASFLGSMLVGDSSLISGKSSNSIRATASILKEKNGSEFVVRKEVNGYRVWRTK